MHEVVPLAVDEDDDVGAEEERLPGVPERRMATGLSRKRLALIDAMVFDGLSRKDAAAKIGITDRASRYALGHPLVMSYYRKQLEVLRQSEKPKSVHRLAELRDQKDSQRIAFEAARELGREPVSSPVINLGIGVNVQPGYVINAGGYGADAQRILDASGSVKNVFSDCEVEQ